MLIWFGRRRITVELTRTGQVASLKKRGPGLFDAPYQDMTRGAVSMECGHGDCCGQLPGAEIVGQLLCDINFFKMRKVMSIL